jgi:6-phosphogluconolactonase (cycloisomerase 2 family)
MTTVGTLHRLVTSLLIVGGGLAACTDSSSTTEPPIDEPPVDPAPPEDPPPPAKVAPKAVYILSNERDANRVITYARGVDGALRPGNAYATGGKGSANGLGSQGALVFDDKERRFFAVNPGDNSLSMLSLESDGTLVARSMIASNGVRPVSVTYRGDLVYVVNAGDATTPANISGFRITNGALTPIDGSSRPLSAAQPAPAQIDFTPDGGSLIVTEKATDIISTYALTAGVAAAPRHQVPAGKTPFGFAWSPKGQLIVSEAFGGGAGLGATSSYVVASDGTLTPKSASVAAAQTAPCWVAVAKNHAFVTNTGSDTVTSYTIGSDGTISLDHANGIASMSAGTPIDVDVSDDENFLYVLGSRSDAISSYAIAANGALTRMPDLEGVSASSVGIIAR